MYQPFENVNLLKDEKKSLRSFRFKPRQKQEQIKCFASLWKDYGFIGLNYFDYVDENGEPVTDGTYSVTQRYERYKVYRKRQRIIHLPNWVAITISLITFLLTLPVLIVQLVPALETLGLLP